MEFAIHLCFGNQIRFHAFWLFIVSIDKANFVIEKQKTRSIILIEKKFSKFRSKVEIFWLKNKKLKTKTYFELLFEIWFFFSIRNRFFLIHDDKLSLITKYLITINSVACKSHRLIFISLMMKWMNKWIFLRIIILFWRKNLKQFNWIAFILHHQHDWILIHYYYFLVPITWDENEVKPD